MAWDYFKPGMKIGGMKILEQLASGSKETARYLVACCDCGRQSESAHVNLERRITKESEGCRICNRHEHRKPKPAKPAPTAELVGVDLGRGNFWPSLGKLGPRWGGSVGANTFIGQGASERGI